MQRFVLWICRIMSLLAIAGIAAITNVIEGHGATMTKGAAFLTCVWFLCIALAVFVLTFIPATYKTKPQPPPARPAAPQPGRRTDCMECHAAPALNFCLTHQLRVCNPCSIQHMGVGCVVQPQKFYDNTIAHLTQGVTDVQR